MSKLELLLLGHFEGLLPSGEPLTLSMRKAEVLLAYLALAPGIRHPRERLTNLLWSDRSEEQARNSLRQCLSTIRKSLGDSAELALQIDRSSVRLNPELIETDALEFERLAADGEFEALSNAAEMYRGEFLEGISIRDAASQEWLDSERARFKRQHIEILVNLGHTQLASKDHNLAIRTGERLVEQDPLAESGWRLLIRAYYENGDRSHALQAFKRCQQVLLDELDVDPEAETIALRNQIATGTSRTAPTNPVTDTPVDREPGDGADSSPDHAASNDHSIAVLPFDNLSGDPAQEYFSDGITSSLILNLGMFNGLNVKSQGSSFAFKHSEKSSTEIARELAADFLIEGSIRKSGSKVRLAVQLVEAQSDTQIWGKQYDSELEDILELEQELSRSIAGTISGRIGHTLQQSAVRKPAKDPQSFDYLMRGLYHFGKMTAGDLVVARQEIEKCLEIDPRNSTAHSNLGVIHHVEVLEGWSKNPARSTELASHHLQTAVEVDPDNAIAHAYLAEFLLNHYDYGRAEFHADRAIELNPTSPEGYTVMADVLGLSRRIDEAIHCADQCLRLDPHSVGSGWAAGGVYRIAGQYEKAIKIFRSISHPPASIHALIATCFIGLDLIEEARNEMQRYHLLARQQMSVYPQGKDAWRAHWRGYESYRFEDDFDEFFDQLVEAGLCDDPVGAGDKVPSIAVLPFENMSGDPEQAFFSDGITADIIATLSKFQHMRIVARHSTEIYRNRKASIADIVTEQNVRYILEGSVRKSGDRIRVNAELIDAASEQNVWSERYDRDLGDIFAVQDEITRNIAVAMKVQLTDGERSASRTEGTRNLKAWELVLLAVDLQDSYIQRNIHDSRKMIRQALELDPEYAYAWVILGWTHWQEAYSGWTESFEQSMLDAAAAVDKALALDPNNGEAWALASTIHLMNHEADKSIAASQRALELESGNAEIHALVGFAMNFIGDYKQAAEHFTRALSLCPICPNWYYLVGAEPEREAGRLDKAIELLRRGVTAEPDSPLCRFYLAEALLEQGEEAAARAVAADIRKLDRTMKSRGLIRSYSNDPKVRERFYQNLVKLDLA